MGGVLCAVVGVPDPVRKEASSRADAPPGYAEPRGVQLMLTAGHMDETRVASRNRYRYRPTAARMRLMERERGTLPFSDPIGSDRSTARVSAIRCIPQGIQKNGTPAFRVGGRWAGRRRRPRGGHRGPDHPVPHRSLSAAGSPSARGRTSAISPQTIIRYVLVNSGVQVVSVM